MARGVNKVILIGNVGGDPETRYMPNGNAVTNITLATTDSWKDKDSGELRERTDWNTVTLFERSTAGFAWLKENLKPGDLVHVRGRIGESNYEKDGQTVYDTSLTADRFAVVPVGKDG